MSAAGIPVVKFLFREDFKVLTEALSLKEVYDIELMDTANDLVTFLSTVSAGLVIISLRDKNDLLQIVSFMKSLKKVAKDTAVKVVIINFSGDQVLENAIAKLGIQDSIDVAITTKALKFKIDFWMKSLRGQTKASPSSATKEKSTKAQSQVVQNSKPTNLSAPQWIHPLEIEDDIWLMKSENDCKKILSKWLVRLLGPGPNVGQWHEVKHGLWRFEIRGEEKELFLPGDGFWYFSGDQKPEFIWKESTWMITGSTFELFYKDDSNTYSRLKSRNKVLEIAENSDIAKFKESIIIESLNKEIVFKKEAPVLENLDGEGKTDKLKRDPLSGDVDFREGKKGALSGETEGEEGLSKFWSGKLGSTQNRPDKNLSGKIKNVPQDVLPFLTLAQEKDLEEITEDATIESFMMLNDKKVECKLDDYFDNKAIFHTDDKTFKVPNGVELELVYQSIINNSELKISGNIITVESDGEGDQYVTVELSKDQIAELQKFMNNFEKRQSNINEFLKRAKGH